MANIRVDVDYALRDGLEMKFRSPVDCSAITGLIVYYPGEDGSTTSQVFTLADAHGNNVGDIDHLFAEDVVVKVILDVTKGMAFVQNADTNAYLEAQLASKRPNTWLPTIAEIGAAPSGYGLGEKLTQVTHIDNAGKNGFYQVNGSVASGHPFDYGAANILVVGGSADLMPTQIGFGISMNPVTNNAMAIRASDGIWEWFNPPMKVGVEYRTVERWNGKPVYTICGDMGTLPSKSFKTFTPKRADGSGVSATQIVGYGGITGTGYAFPMRGSDISADYFANVEMYVNTDITAWVYCNLDWSTTTATLWFKYTKD